MLRYLAVILRTTNLIIIQFILIWALMVSIGGKICFKFIQSMNTQVNCSATGHILHGNKKDLVPKEIMRVFKRVLSRSNRVQNHPWALVSFINPSYPLDYPISKYWANPKWREHCRDNRVVTHLLLLLKIFKARSFPNKFLLYKSTHQDGMRNECWRKRATKAQWWNR